MRKVFLIVLFVAALAIAVGCSSYGQNHYPRVQVVIEESINPTEYELPMVDPAAPEELFKVEIKNSGSSPLIVYDVQLAPGSNRYLSIVWNGSTEASDLPAVVIQPDAPADFFWFVLRYDPEEEPIDLNDSKLVITTNDPEEGETVSCPDWPKAPWITGEGPDVDKPSKCAERVVTIKVQKIGPVMQLNAKLLTFSCVFTTKSQSVTIDNSGTDPLEVTYIDFDYPSSEFTLVDRPTLPAIIPPKGEPNYAPLTFQVLYEPVGTDYNDDNRIRIESNDVTAVGGATYIDITVKQKPAVLDITTSSDSGFNLDFESTKTHSVTVYNRTAAECNNLCAEPNNCCGCPIMIQSLVLEPVDNAPWYTVSVVDVDTGATLDVGGGRSLPPGKGFRFDIKYARPVGFNEDRNASLLINYLAPQVGAQVLRYNLLSAKQCDLRIAPRNKVLSFNAEGATDKPVKSVALVNLGNAPCSIGSVITTDSWSGPSEYFSIANGWDEGGQVPAFGISLVDIQFTPKPGDMKGYLKITYDHPTKGQQKESLSLSGTSLTACSIPVADPGTVDYYSGYSAGDIITLNGCSSLPGSCSSAAIFTSGYIWYLLDKPAGSGVYLNEDGACTTSMVVDLPGKYTVALMVFDEEDYYQSDMAKVVIDVGE